MVLVVLLVVQEETAVREGEAVARAAAHLPVGEDGGVEALEQLLDQRCSAGGKDGELVGGGAKGVIVRKDLRLVALVARSRVRVRARPRAQRHRMAAHLHGRALVSTLLAVGHRTAAHGDAD